MIEAGVRTAPHGRVAVVTLDRPGKRNAIDPALCIGLRDALCGDADAYVITGGGRDFCAGFDAHALRAVREPARFMTEMQSVFEHIEATPRPVVAAIDGYALGMGFELALVCDAAVATVDATFGLPEITHGLFPPIAVGRGLDVLGRGWIRHLAVSGRRWCSGVEAHDLGLVAELAARAELVAAAVSLAADFAANPAFSAGKRVLNRGAERAYRMSAETVAPLFRTLA
ncbi:MAG TPA: enoyl-CoA hydratase/isomerase family protein [Pseudonocardiaceae bacterium]